MASERPSIQLTKQQRKRLNQTTKDGHTKLTLSIVQEKDDNFIINLIRLGCNANKPGKNGFLPLHLSMKRLSIKVALELIHYGADIDAHDAAKYAPLHYAVYYRNVEAICMLLYHGADVNVLNDFNKTPLMMSLEFGEDQISKILLNYYAEFSCRSIFNTTVLDSAIMKMSPLAIDLVSAGADVNYSCRNFNTPVVGSLSYDTSDLFKLIWSKLNLKGILNRSQPFLITYMEMSKFSNAEWIECLYLILSSRIGVKLIEECRYFNNTPVIECRLLSDALKESHHRKIQSNERLGIFYHFMGMGVTACILDINYAIDLYGFNQEVQALIYAGNFKYEAAAFRHTYPIHYGYLAFENCTDKKHVLFCFWNLISSGRSEAEVARALDYYTMTSDTKLALTKFASTWYNTIPEEMNKKLEQQPKIPSLLEISRDKAREYIQKTYEVKRPYEFHDAVKNLCLPKSLKDLLLCKVPIHYQ